MKLAFTKDALADLQNISRFTRRTYGKLQAKWYLGQIEFYCDALVSGRYRGQAVDAISPGLRKQVVESHIIFFRVSSDEMVVVRILHVAMNHQGHL